MGAGGKGRGKSTRQTWGKQLVKSPRQDCTGRETFGKVIKVQLCQNVVFPFYIFFLFWAIVFGYLITGAGRGKVGVKKNRADIQGTWLKLAKIVLTKS